MTRASGRTDQNQSAIVDALRAVGCSVQSLADVGRGCPDLLVGCNGRSFLIEVKDGSLPESKRRLTPMQRTWHQNWQAPVHLVETINDAMLVVSSYRGRRVA